MNEFYQKLRWPNNSSHKQHLKTGVASNISIEWIHYNLMIIIIIIIIINSLFHQLYQSRFCCHWWLLSETFRFARKLYFSQSCLSVSTENRNFVVALFFVRVSPSILGRRGERLKRQDSNLGQFAELPSSLKIWHPLFFSTFKPFKIGAEYLLCSSGGSMLQNIDFFPR